MWPGNTINFSSGTHGWKAKLNFHSERCVAAEVSKFPSLGLAINEFPFHTPRTDKTRSGRADVFFVRVIILSLKRRISGLWERGSVIYTHQSSDASPFSIMRNRNSWRCLPLRFCLQWRADDGPQKKQHHSCAWAHSALYTCSHSRRRRNSGANACRLNNGVCRILPIREQSLGSRSLKSRVPRTENKTWPIARLHYICALINF